MGRSRRNFEGLEGIISGVSFLVGTQKREFFKKALFPPLLFEAGIVGESIMCGERKWLCVNAYMEEEKRGKRRVIGTHAKAEKVSKPSPPFPHIFLLFSLSKMTYSLEGKRWLRGNLLEAGNPPPLLVLTSAQAGDFFWRRSGKMSITRLPPS